MVIEVDGGSHEKKKERDKLRDSFLKSCGIKTIRFTNEEIFNDIEKVKNRIRDLLI